MWTQIDEKKILEVSSLTFLEPFCSPFALSISWTELDGSDRTTFNSLTLSVVVSSNLMLCFLWPDMRDVQI
jgi:hypothetical protein